MREYYYKTWLSYFGVSYLIEIRNSNLVEFDVIVKSYHWKLCPCFFQDCFEIGLLD